MNFLKEKFCKFKVEGYLPKWKPNVGDLISRQKNTNLLEQIYCTVEKSRSLSNFGSFR